MSAPAATTNARTLLLWGDTQVGKSTLLVTALYRGRAALPVIDHERSAEGLNLTLSQQYQRLSSCQWVLPTSVTFVDVDMHLRSGVRLRIRDVPGAFTRDIHDREISARLREADAVLFVVEWNARELARQMTAIRTSWSLLGDRPKALAVTKCEKHLPREDRAWARPSGWWRQGRWQEHHEVLEAFGDAVFPTSAYGYHHELEVPAVVLGEFGQLLPFGVCPRGVAEPFRYLLAELGER